MRGEPALDVLAGGAEALQRRGEVAGPAERARATEHASSGTAAAVVVATTHLEYLEKYTNNSSISYFKFKTLNSEPNLLFEYPF